MIKKSNLFLILFSLFISSEYLYANDSKIKKEAVKLTYTEQELQKEISTRLLKKMKDLDHDGVLNLSHELMIKEQELKLEELKLLEQKKLIKKSQQDLVSKINFFTKRQQKMIDCMDDHDRAKIKRILHMVKIVSKMKPLKASELLSAQDQDLSISILAKLSSEKVAKIFNLMPKEISARLQKEYLNMQK